VVVSVGLGDVVVGVVVGFGAGVVVVFFLVVLGGLDATVGVALTGATAVAAGCGGGVVAVVVCVLL
jgi:hypothetical protein